MGDEQFMGYMPVVIAAEYLSDYKIKLTFNNGEKRIADCLQWLNGSMARFLNRLKINSIFRNSLSTVGLYRGRMVQILPLRLCMNMGMLQNSHCNKTSDALAQLGCKGSSIFVYCI